MPLDEKAIKLYPGEMEQVASEVRELLHLDAVNSEGVGPPERDYKALSQRLNNAENEKSEKVALLDTEERRKIAEEYIMDHFLHALRQREVDTKSRPFEPNPLVVDAINRRAAVVTGMRERFVDRVSSYLLKQKNSTLEKMTNAEMKSDGSTIEKQRRGLIGEGSRNEVRREMAKNLVLQYYAGAEKGIDEELNKDMQVSITMTKKEIASRSKIGRFGKRFFNNMLSGINRLKKAFVRKKGISGPILQFEEKIRDKHNLEFSSHDKTEAIFNAISEMDQYAINKHPRSKEQQDVLDHKVAGILDMIDASCSNVQKKLEDNWKSDALEEKKRVAGIEKAIWTLGHYTTDENRLKKTLQKCNETLNAIDKHKERRPRHEVRVGIDDLKNKRMYAPRENVHAEQSKKVLSFIAKQMEVNIGKDPHEFEKLGKKWLNAIDNHCKQMVQALEKGSKKDIFLVKDELAAMSEAVQKLNPHVDGRRLKESIKKRGELTKTVGKLYNNMKHTEREESKSVRGAYQVQAQRGGK